MTDTLSMRSTGTNRCCPRAPTRVTEFWAIYRFIASPAAACAPSNAADTFGSRAAATDKLLSQLTVISTNRGDAGFVTNSPSRLMRVSSRTMPRSAPVSGSSQSTHD